MKTRFDRLILVFKDMGGNIMQLNGEFEIQLIIEDGVECEHEYEGVQTLILANQMSIIEVFGNTTKKEVKLDNPLSFDQCYISSVSLYTDFVCTTCQLIKWC